MVPAGAAAPFLSARCAHPRFLRAAARLRLPGARGAWFGRCGRGLIVCACAVSRAAAAGALRVLGRGCAGRYPLPPLAARGELRGLRDLPERRYHCSQCGFHGQTMVTYTTQCMTTLRPTLS